MIVYKATNLINEKVYIGQTIKELDKRIQTHNSKALRHPTSHFHCALKKYGPENFKWVIVCKCHDRNLLSQREIAFICLYNSDDRNYGYNITAGGRGGDVFFSRPIKEETRRKMREAHLGRAGTYGFQGKHHTEEWKKNMSGKNHPLWGKHHSEETKQRIRESKLGKSRKPHSEETKKKLRKYIYKIKSPLGEVHITDGLKQFCEEYKDFGIMYKGMKSAVRRSGRYKGWFISRKLKENSNHQTIKENKQ